MSKKKVYHEIDTPFPNWLFGNMVVDSKSLAEMRKNPAKTGEKIRVIRSYSK